MEGPLVGSPWEPVEASFFGGTERHRPGFTANFLAAMVQYIYGIGGSMLVALTWMGVKSICLAVGHGGNGWALNVPPGIVACVVALLLISRFPQPPPSRKHLGEEEPSSA